MWQTFIHYYFWGDFQELSLRMERLTDDSKQKKHVLEHETTETLTAQIELDKTAEDFRKAHQERQNLIEQWEHTIEQMQRRDKEMDLLAAVCSCFTSYVMYRFGFFFQLWLYIH